MVGKLFMIICGFININFPARYHIIANCQYNIHRVGGFLNNLQIF